MSLPVSEVVPFEEMLSDELTLVDVELDVAFEEPALEPPTAAWQFLTTLPPASIVRERWNSVVATAPSVVVSTVWIEARAVFAAINPFVRLIPSASFGASPATRESAMAARPSVAVFNPSLAALTAVSGHSSDLLHRFGRRSEVSRSLNASNVTHDGRIHSPCRRIWNVGRTCDRGLH